MVDPPNLPKLTVAGVAILIAASEIAWLALIGWCVFLVRALV